MINRRSFTGAALAAAAAQRAKVSFAPAGGKIEVLIGGAPFTAFHFDPKWDKPFLHPLRAASGKVLTRWFPIEDRPGERQDHPWHRGIWWGHGDINGEDFWREQGREKTARLALVSPPHTSGSTLSAKLALEARDGRKLGTVLEEFSFEQAGANRFIDARIAISADRGVALKFGDTDDGGFAFRLSDAFRQDAGAELRNSEGLVTTEKIWGKPARWVDYTAVVEGEKTGVAIFDHPSNLRHPTRWHARGYSLCAANPFALRSFTGDPSQDGSYVLPAGGRLAFRYRVVIHPGDAREARLEELYRDFSVR